MRTKPDINSNPRALGAFRVQFMPASLGRVAQLEFEPEGGKMSAILKSTMALALLSGTVYAAQPPDVVGSDTEGNTAMGAEALHNLTSGYYNTASGLNALFSNTTGSYNTASGSNALYSNTTGTHNTASGYEALYFTTTGIEDTGVGYGALHTNTTGKENTALGNEALYP